MRERPQTGSDRSDALVLRARLDGLRGCAAVSVVVDHALIFLPGGAVGDRVGARIGLTSVAVFFALSGYLLYRPFVEARTSGRALPSVRRFAIRRVLRIFPPYWLALTVLALWPGLVGVFTSDWWIYYGLMQVYDLEAATTGGLGPAWTLCVDVSFYALLPLFAWFVATRPSGTAHRVEIVLLGAGAVAALAFRMVLGDESETFNWTQTLLATFGWFAMGMVIASARAGGSVGMVTGAVRRLTTRPVACLLVAAIVQAALFAMGLAYVKPPLETAVEFVGHGLVAALLLAAVLSAPSRRRPEHPLTLSGRPAAALARISYGMYLWHAPVAANLSLSRLAEAPGGGVVYVVGAVLASAACGAVSYFLVERHVLRSRWYAGRPRHAGWDVPPP